MDDDKMKGKGSPRTLFQNNKIHAFKQKYM